MITIVSGFGRSGTSLVCQMLAAGGMKGPPAALYPMYEDPVSGQCMRRGDLRVRSAYLRFYVDIPGRFMKCLGLDGLGRLLKGLPYRFIWTERDPDEQAKSWRKFRCWRGHADDQSSEEIKAIFTKRRPACFEIMEALGTGKPLVVHFEDLLRMPTVQALGLEEFVGQRLDISAMAGQVRPRKPEMLANMLEDELIASRGEKVQ
eukprot:GHVU01206386.1.p1 GENE.GHVU01206386.1~~GHVU01206386.1.p1  ORF type:complete len:204 (-),score=28.27 GHVU01206386.1:478-1089(-)